MLSPWLTHAGHKQHPLETCCSGSGRELPWFSSSSPLSRKSCEPSPRRGPVSVTTSTDHPQITRAHEHPQAEGFKARRKGRAVGFSDRILRKTCRAEALSLREPTTILPSAVVAACAASNQCSTAFEDDDAVHYDTLEKNSLRSGCFGGLSDPCSFSVFYCGKACTSTSRYSLHDIFENIAD